MQVTFDKLTGYYKATYKHWHTYGDSFGQAISNMLGIIDSYNHIYEHLRHTK